jgi:hypothetical protein
MTPRHCTVSERPHAAGSMPALDRAVSSRSASTRQECRACPSLSACVCVCARWLVPRTLEFKKKMATTDPTFRTQDSTQHKEVGTARRSSRTRRLTASWTTGTAGLPQERVGHTFACRARLSSTHLRFQLQKKKVKKTVIKTCFSYIFCFFCLHFHVGVWAHLVPGPMLAS